MTKPIVALMYDFDKTLCTKDMQEYGFIPNLGMKAPDFWKSVSDLTDREGMDSVLAYMYMMVEKAKEKRISVTRSTFNELGRSVQFFEGVEQWFSRINSYGEKCGVTVEHYIVSSGIKEIIEGTSIAHEFKRIYACEFMYDYNGLISWPKLAVNYTDKTQFFFRINKGVLDITSKSTEELNKYTPEHMRRVPFRNMIYIGDGLTDVPCMKLTKAYGGKSIAVYNGEGKGRDTALALLDNDRVNYVLPADYRENSKLDQAVKLIINKVKAVEELEEYR